MRERQPKLPNLFNDEEGTGLADRREMAISVRYRVVLHKAAPVFHDLPGYLQTLIRLCDGRRTVAQLAQHSTLSKGQVTRLLDQLVEVGMIERADESPEVRAQLSEAALRWVTEQRVRGDATMQMPLSAMSFGETLDQAPIEVVDSQASPAAEPMALADMLEPIVTEQFSDDEEAFFAQSIDHLVADDYFG